MVGIVTTVLGALLFDNTPVWFLLAVAMPLGFAAYWRLGTSRSGGFDHESERAMTAAITITDLTRYPVKGLAGQSLQQVDVSTRRGVHGDRPMAIAHASSTFDHETGSWVPRRNFVVAAHSPPIVTLGAEYDAPTASVTISDLHGGRLMFDSNARSTGKPLVNMLVDLTGDVQPGPYRIAMSDDAGSLTDYPVAAVSMMNAGSLSSLEHELDCQLDPRRFRGNLWFSGVAPWEEMNWLSQEFAVGRVRLKVLEPIVRCAAVDVNPLTGERDIQLLKGLSRMQGHSCFGVLAEVTHDGALAVGDEIRQL